MADTGLPDSRCNQDQKYEVILEMRDLTRKGMASKVVEEINNMDPDFFLKNPILLFQLKQVRPVWLTTRKEKIGNPDMIRTSMQV